MNVQLRLILVFFTICIFLLLTGCSSQPSVDQYVNAVSHEDSLVFYSKLDAGNSARISGELEKAKGYMKQAIKVADTLNWGQGLAQSYTNLAYVNLYESDFEAAMENSVEGLRIAEKCNDLSSQGFANMLIGFIYFNLGDTSQVLPYYYQSVKIRKHLGNDYDLGYSYSYLGNFYLSSMNYDSALFYHNKALFHRLKTDDERSIADSYLLIGSTYEKQMLYSEAMEYFQQAILKYAKIKDKKRLAETYRNFAEVYLAEDNLTDAENFLLQAKQLATETGSLDNLVLIADQLAGIKYEQGKFEEAYDNLRYHVDTYHKTSGESKYRDIVKNILEYKNEKEKKIKQLEFDQKEEKQQLIVLSVSGLLLLVVGFLFFVFNRLKLVRKQKEIIAYRKDQVDKAFIELEGKNKEILDSITYAKRIQSAILPSDESIQKYLPKAFVLYLPKDIVAGDFYWLEQKDNKVLFAAADCTGHGVPGAMVSVVCNNSLNRSVHEVGLTKPAQILNQTRDFVVSEFEKSSKDMTDGMDIALCSLDVDSKQLEFSGAYNPLWVIRKGASEIEEYKGDKQPIGKMDNSAEFHNHSVKLEEGDTIYIFSDGYVDQFGGERGKKFKSSNLRKLLLSIQEHELEQQREILYRTFENWRGDLEQIDDVCVIGFRL